MPSQNEGSCDQQSDCIEVVKSGPTRKGGIYSNFKSKGGWNKDPIEAGDRFLVPNGEYVLSNKKFCKQCDQYERYVMVNIVNGDHATMPEDEFAIEDRISKTYKNAKGEMVLKLRYLDEGEHYTCQVLYQDERFGRNVKLEWFDNVHFGAYPDYVDNLIYLRGNHKSLDVVYFDIPKKEMNVVDKNLIKWSKNCKRIQ